MLPFAHGVDYFVEERKYIKPPGRNSAGRNSKDHEVLLLPVSPSRGAASIFHNLLRSRLTWLVLFVVIVVSTFFYHNYQEQQKQLRLAGYMERIEELKLSMKRVKHHLLAGGSRVQEMKQIIFTTYYRNNNNNSSSPIK